MDAPQRVEERAVQREGQPVAARWDRGRASAAGGERELAEGVGGVRDVERALVSLVAPLEGAAFLGCITYLIDGQFFQLAVPGAVLAMMALTFPTRERIGQWLEMQQTCINERRSDRGA